jgi:hypothetical protein
MLPLPAHQGAALKCRPLCTHAPQHRHPAVHRIFRRPAIGTMRRPTCPPGRPRGVPPSLSPLPGWRDTQGRPILPADSNSEPSHGGADCGSEGWSAGGHARLGPTLVTRPGPARHRPGTAQARHGPGPAWPMLGSARLTAIGSPQSIGRPHACWHKSTVRTHHSAESQPEAQYGSTSGCPTLLLTTRRHSTRPRPPWPGQADPC